MKTSLQKGGWKLSAEVRKRMSLGQLKRKPPSEETKRKTSLALKGRKLSSEHCRRISLGQIGRKHSAETKRKITLANLRRGPLSEETKQKMSAAQKGKKLRAETKQRMSLAHKGKKFSKARCKRMRGMWGLTHSANARKKISVSNRKYWKSKTKQERVQHTYAMRKAATCSPSGLERIMHQHLHEAGVTFTTQKAFPPYSVDIFIPSMNLVVECDGAYWHNLPGVWERDCKRDHYIISRYNVRVVRVPEKCIRENLKLVVSTILGGER